MKKKSPEDKEDALFRKYMQESCRADYTAPAIYLSDHLSEELVLSESVISYFQNPLSPSHKKQLIQGKIPIDARLDLHGLTIEQARKTITKKLILFQEQGFRLILLIHGKGGASFEKPILKNHVNNWLRQIPQVLAFHSAQPIHGGTGALYVLLKTLNSREIL